MSKPHKLHHKRKKEKPVRKVKSSVPEKEPSHGHSDDKPDNYRANKPTFPGDRGHHRPR